MHLFKKFRKKNQVQAPDTLLSEETMHTQFAESYRSLRTNIHFSGLEHDVRSVLITSAGAREGKTSTAANLGWILARQGKSVVLVDCDLRRPGLSKTVDSTSSIGLTGLVADLLGIPVNGSIEGSWTLPDIATLIDLQKKTGKLSACTQSGTVELYFHAGKPVDLAWPDCPEELRCTLPAAQGGAQSEERGGMDQQPQDPGGRKTGERLSLLLQQREAVHGSDPLGLQRALHEYIGKAFFGMQENAEAGIAFTFTDRSETRKYQSAMSNASLLPQILLEGIYSGDTLPVIDNSIRNALIQAEERLMILPSGQIPPNPSELVGSVRLQCILSRLQHMHDFMIIDTPPVLPVSDALLLSQHVDGVLMVTRAAYMNRAMISRALDQLRDAKAHLLGMVLNRVDIQKERYYRNSGKYYHGYYEQQKH